MKLKNIIFINGFVDALRAISNQALPKKDAFALNKFIKSFDDNAKVFADMRNELFKKYGEPVEGTDQVSIKEENKEVFMKEFQELAEVENDYTDTTITLPDSVTLTGQQVALLEGIIA